MADQDRKADGTLKLRSSSTERTSDGDGFGGVIFRL
jgi:hypothetical protein